MNVNDEQINDLLGKKKFQNHKNVIKFAVNLLSDYCIENSCDLEKLSNYELTNCYQSLAHCTNVEGISLKKNSMQSLRYGIVCHLKQSREVDISAGKEFARSNEVYHAVWSA